MPRASFHFLSYWNTLPGRVRLVAVHLTLSGSLLILNREAIGGILRVIRDWHPLMLFPLLYKEVELLAAVIGDWRLTAAIPAWESALRRATEPVPERTAGDRTAVQVPAFLPAVPIVPDGAPIRIQSSSPSPFCRPRLHTFTATVVPEPAAEAIVNSSTSRLVPLSPNPIPPRVE